MGQLKRGKAAQMGDEYMKSTAKSFHSLVTDDRTDSISSPAILTLEKRKLTRKEELTKTSDLKKLSTFAYMKMKAYVSKLMVSPDINTWHGLCSVVFVLVTVVNKRRGGEMARLRVTNSEDRQGEHNEALSKRREAGMWQHQKLIHVPCPSVLLLHLFRRKLIKIMFNGYDSCFIYSGG